MKSFDILTIKNGAMDLHSIPLVVTNKLGNDVFIEPEDVFRELVAHVGCEVEDNRSYRVIVEDLSDGVMLYVAAKGLDPLAEDVTFGEVLAADEIAVIISIKKTVCKIQAQTLIAICNIVNDAKKYKKENGL